MYLVDITHHTAAPAPQLSPSTNQIARHCLRCAVVATAEQLLDLICVFTTISSLVHTTCHLRQLLEVCHVVILRELLQCLHQLGGARRPGWVWFESLLRASRAPKRLGTGRLAPLSKPSLPVLHYKLLGRHSQDLSEVLSKALKEAYLPQRDAEALQPAPTIHHNSGPTCCVSVCQTRITSVLQTRAATTTDTHAT